MTMLYWVLSVGTKCDRASQFGQSSPDAAVKPSLAELANLHSQPVLALLTVD